MGGMGDSGSGADFVYCYNKDDCNDISTKISGWLVLTVAAVVAIMVGFWLQ